MDRITNESNLWLNAIQMEDEGNYLKAFLFYLKDSAECIKQNSHVRAALSCSCAANCLFMSGNVSGARQLYLQAANFYEINAVNVIGTSVREALWSYQEAYEYFSLACEFNKARQIYENYLSLSRKINPFFDEKEVMQSLRMMNNNMETYDCPNSANMRVSADIDNAIKNFLNEMISTNSSESHPNVQCIIKKTKESKP